MKEKLINFKASFDNKFEKYKKIFYILTYTILTASFLPLLIEYDTIRAFPKPLEYLYKVNGVVISHSYNRKDKTVGTLVLKLDNGDTEHFRIFSSDDEIYKNLKGKKAIIYASEATLIYASEATFLREPTIKQIENIEGEILIKYDFNKEINNRTKKTLDKFLFYIYVILSFIFIQIFFYDLRLQYEKSKQGVKND